MARQKLPRNRNAEGFLSHFNGINEGRKTSQVPDEDLLEAFNVDLNPDGSVSRRVPFIQMIDFLGDLSYTPIEVFGSAFFSQYNGNRFIVFAIPDSTAANGKLYKYDFTSITALTGNFGKTRKYDFQTFMDKLYIADGVGKIIEWDGSAAPARLADAQTPLAGYLEEYQGYLFAAGETLFPNNLTFSNLGDATAWDAVDVIAVGNDSEVITGLKKWNNALYIFKESSIYVLTGSSRSNFIVSPLSTDFGLIFPFAIGSDDAGIYFVSSSYEFFKFDGSFQLLSNNINTLNDYSSFNAVTAVKSKIVFIPNLDNIMYVYHKKRGGMTKYDLLRPGVVDSYDFGYMYNLVEATNQSDLGVYYFLTTKGIFHIEFVIPALENLPSNNVTGEYWKEYKTATFDDAVDLVCGNDNRFTPYMDTKAILAKVNKTTDAITLMYSKNATSTWTASVTSITGTGVVAGKSLYKKTGAASWDWDYFMVMTTSDICLSTDGGVSWSSVWRVANCAAMDTDYSVALDTTYIIAAIGEKIYTSDDYGSTWVDRGVLTTGEDVNDVISTSAGSGNFVAISDTKILISADYGATWTAVATIAGTTLSKLANAGSGNLLLINSENPSTGIYSSDNYGVTWTTVGEVGATAYIHRIFGFSGVYFAAIEGATSVTLGDSGIYKSADAGATWRRTDVISAVRNNFRVNDMDYVTGKLIASIQTDRATPASGDGKVLYQPLALDVCREPLNGYKYYNEISSSIKTNILLDDSEMLRQIKFMYLDGRLSSGTLKIYDRGDNVLETITLTGSSVYKWVRVDAAVKNGYKIEIIVDDKDSNFVLSKLGIGYADIRKTRKL